MTLPVLVARPPTSGDRAQIRSGADPVALGSVIARACLGHKEDCVYDIGAISGEYLPTTLRRGLDVIRHAINNFRYQFCA